MVRAPADQSAGHDQLAAHKIKREALRARHCLRGPARENGNRAMFDPDSPLDLDQLRARLRAMSDRMLAHWGASAAYMCTPEANFGAPPRQVFVIQLEAAR